MDQKLPPDLPSPLSIVCGSPGLQLALSKMCVSDNVHMLCVNNSGVPELSHDAFNIVESTVKKVVGETLGSDFKSEAVKASLQMFVRILEPTIPSIPLETPENIETSTSSSDDPPSLKSVVSKKKKRKSLPRQDILKQEDKKCGFFSLIKKLVNVYGNTPWIRKVDSVFDVPSGNSRNVPTLQNLPPVLTLPHLKPVFVSSTGNQNGRRSVITHSVSERCLLCVEFAASNVDRTYSNIFELALCHISLDDLTIYDHVSIRGLVKKFEDPP
jgi:hypothetical protein